MNPTSLTINDYIQRNLDNTARKHNNFDLIRLLAALGVVLAHSFPLALGNADVTILGLMPAGSLGAYSVFIFFSISGFLITQSFCQSKHWLSFIEARFLRIYPGLIFTTFFSVFIIGFGVFHYNDISYLKNMAVYHYTAKVLLMHATTNIPNLFEHNPFPYAINGSLWTLWLEVEMYGLVFLLGMFGVLNRRWLANSIIILLYIFWPLFHHVSILIPLSDPSIAGLRIQYMFLIGMLFYLNRDKIKLSFSTGLIFLALALLLRNTSFALVCTVYWLFLLAYVPKIHLSTWLRGKDYSYGTYIFAFPIQQTLVALFKINTPLHLFFTALPCIIIMAAFSWHFIEKPMLGLKGKTVEWLMSFKQRALENYP